MLDVNGLHKNFRGIAAVQDVSFNVNQGEVVSLIGPNGAGKTTLFNVVTGLERPDEGRVLLHGRDVSGRSPYRRARLGMGRTFQRLEVFGSLTAYGNVLAAAEFRKGWARDKSDPRLVAREVLERVRLTDVAERRVDAMPTGLARLVELARALATRPALLLLDEPGSGLNHEETDNLGTLLLELVTDGTAILLVEHDVELVMRVCRQVNVLDFGRIIATGTPKEVQSDGAVQAAYLGADTSQVEGAA
jgi:branched-chain amino acid transport system ATP-binding protein